MKDCICRNGLECAACLMKLYDRHAYHNVFVYGTLKSGYKNHRMAFKNRKYEWLANTTTLPEYGIVYAGTLPFLIKDKLMVHGEVYRINGRFLSALDQLEGHPHNYKRTMITLYNDQKAFVYLAGKHITKQLNKYMDQLVVTDNFDVKEWRND